MPHLIGDATDNGTADFPIAPEDAVDLHGLAPALRRLDRVITQAVVAAADAFGPDAAADPYRGLVIRGEEVERLLARTPAAPTLSGAVPDAFDAGPTSPRLARLGRAFGLTTFDLDTVLVALAPELDLRYERLYAYLQDDVNRRRPSVDLVLNLLCVTAAERLAQRARFAAAAPLRWHGLLDLVQDPNRAHSPLLAHDLKLDEQVVRWLLGSEDIDERVAGFARRVSPPPHELASHLPELERTLLVMMDDARRRDAPLRVGLQGPPGNGQAAVVERL